MTEADKAILVCSRSLQPTTTNGFLEDYRRVNVAISRTKKGIIVLGEFVAYLKAEQKNGTSLQGREAAKKMPFTQLIEGEAKEKRLIDSSMLKNSEILQDLDLDHYIMSKFRMGERVTLSRSEYIYRTGWHGTGPSAIMVDGSRSHMGSSNLGGCEMHSYASQS